MKPMLVLWMFIALFLVVLIGVGVHHFPKPRLNVSPDAGREIQKAMHK